MTGTADVPPAQEPETRSRAEAMDAADELAGFRNRFVVADPSTVYLDGNSLGRLPKATVDRVADEVGRGWGDRLVRAWDEGWMELAGEIADVIGTRLLGARPGEVVVGDSTTVNLYKLCSAAAAARPGRTAIVTDRDNFPTDRYVAEGVAAARGMELRWVDADMVEGPQPADVAAALDDRVALVTLSHVAYRTAAIADMAAITALAHEAGALTLWDLSHAVGSVPVDLTVSGADLAVGCTYKYLNGGPGAPAFLYVRSGLQEELRQPIWGWLGRRDPFEMAQGYDAAPGLTAFLSGTPPILSMAPIEEGVRMLVEAGLDRLRSKGIALTEYAIELFDRWLAPLGFALGSPRAPERRGSHVLFRHDRAKELYEALLRRNVVADYREPQGIRVGLAPLTTRFVDVHDGLATLAELAS
ncbi:MAG TPA: kynureninase [Actinomycetota bacterium]|nr:kynureninase [Actinomycetota bacterium]